MVQPGPDTRTEGWDACSGYHWSDSSLLGFSQTHLSGTGCADFLDFLIYPSVHGIAVSDSSLVLPPVAFSHRDEKASPGYYSVRFADGSVLTEISAAPRTAVYRFTFLGDGKRQIALDLLHAPDETKVLKTQWKQLSDNELEGMRITSGFLESGRYVHFNARFSEPFARVVRVSGSQVLLEFPDSVGELTVAMGISITSCANAALNSHTEVPRLDFDSVRAAAAGTWDKALSVIDVPKGSREDLTVFYTALYHSLLAPMTASDVNGEFRSHDGGIRRTDPGRRYVSTISFWDIFRSWLPLNSLIDHKILNDIAWSSLEMYDAAGELPLWPLANGETYCMIGYHSIPFFAEAYLDGYADFDADRALDAMIVSSKRNRKGSAEYLKYGFVPSEACDGSVSITLEYAYDDWCIARMAEKMGRAAVAEEYYARARNYRNLFDPSVRFFRGRHADGKWADGFDRYLAGRDFTEATPWHYRFFVPHDIGGLRSLFGAEAFTEALDSLFTTETPVDPDFEDITGFYGLYAHGNEPSHHNAFIYSYIGQPWKTQNITRDLLQTMYSAKPDGIVGNEDCGQMSAWYIMSALGLYEPCPGSGEYCLTAPLFPEAMLRLADGKALTIRADRPSCRYIDSVSFNGRKVEGNFISYDDLKDGGTLSFKLSSTPRPDSR